MPLVNRPLRVPSRNDLYGIALALTWCALGKLDTGICRSNDWRGRLRYRDAVSDRSIGMVNPQMRHYSSIHEKRQKLRALMPNPPALHGWKIPQQWRHLVNE